MSRQAEYQDKRNIVNKAYLIEPIIRHRIQDSVFYKQYLYLTNEATILNVVTNNITYISGTDSIGRPSPFICCLLRLLELDPSQKILDVYLNQSEFKYLTALILLYYRMTINNELTYTTLESYYTDYRKLLLKLKNPEITSTSVNHYTLTYIDEWVDFLLTKERLIDIMLPRLTPRYKLLESNLLKPRQYYIDVEDDTNVNVSDSYESDSD